MISLVLSEIRKLFKNKLNLILFFLVLFVPLALTFYGQLPHTGLDINGVQINNLEYLKAYQKYEQKYAGEVNQEWLDGLEQSRKEISKPFLLRVLDNEKMKETYGDDWQDQDFYYDAYYHVGEENEFPELFYRFDHPAPVTKTDLELEIELTVLTKAINYGNFMESETWRLPDNGNDHSIWQDEYGNTIKRETRVRPQVETNLINHNFEGLDHVYFGATTGWELAINALSNYGVVFAFYLILLFSSMFNKENKDKTLSLIKTTKEGKRKVGLAKILAGLIVAIVLPLLVIGIIYLFYQLIIGLGNPNTLFNYRLFENSDVSTSLTCGETYLVASGLLLVGSVTIAILSMFFSSLLKSSYKSLAVSFIVFLLPLVFNFKIGTFAFKLLSPIEYLNSSFYSFGLVSSIGNYAFYNMEFVIKTSGWVLILLPFIYLFYQKGNVGND